MERGVSKMRPPSYRAQSSEVPTHRGTGRTLSVRILVLVAERVAQRLPRLAATATIGAFTRDYRLGHNVSPETTGTGAISLDDGCCSLPPLV